MGNREEFEKWSTKAGFHILKDAFGDYILPGVESAWVTWQARQPEIDAKDKVIDDLALKKGILKAHRDRIMEENVALKDEVERLRNENIDLSVRAEALNDLVDAPFANTTENRKLVRELWEKSE